MKPINNKKKYKYALGSFVEAGDDNAKFNAQAQAGGQLGTMLGGAIGGNTGNVISGISSGAAAGAALGPYGALAGGVIGLGASLLGNSKQKRMLANQRKDQYNSFNTNYQDNFNSQFDTNNENPYGLQSFANGGIIPSNVINIEKGELQIDPQTGKVLREYTGINPENGDLYQPHSKGRDPNANIVTAEPGTFIVTKALAKDYKTSLDNNDQIKRNTILQNIKNIKDSKDKSSKMAFGSYVDPTKPPLLSAQNPQSNYDFNSVLNQYMGLAPSPQVGIDNIQPFKQVNQLQGQLNNTTNTSTPTQNGTNKLGGILNTAANYAPALANIGQGLFGKVDQTPLAQAQVNPYLGKIINNLPQDVNLSPLIQRLNRNQNNQFATIDQQTSSSPIARANKQNVFANTQNQIGDLYFQQGQANNQIRGQRAGVYAGLGSQSMQEAARVQQLNLGIDQSNQQNRAAKTNLLNTGLGQLQQTYQNGKLIDQQKSNDAIRNKLLYEMFPNLRFYQNTFGQ